MGAQSDARYSCGHRLSLRRSTQMSFLPLFFQRRCLTHSPKERSSQNHIPFRRSFSCNRQNKKPIHRDIKNRREHCSRFKMMKLCIGFEIQIRGICLLTNHAGRQCGIGWCGNVRLPLSSNQSFILYSVIVLLWHRFTIHYKTYVCQCF